MSLKDISNDLARMEYEGNHKHNETQKTVDKVFDLIIFEFHYICSLFNAKNSEFKFHMQFFPFYIVKNINFYIFFVKS